MSGVVARFSALGVISLVAGFAAMTSPGCAAVLRVDEYEGAVDALCCGEVVRAVSDCTERVKDGLDSDPEAAESWISRFDDNCRCNLACFARAPVCLSDGAACARSGECCGATNGGGCCPHLIGGSTCCTGCRTCTALATDGQRGELYTCVQAGELFQALTDCLCREHADDCEGTELCKSRDAADLGEACRAHLTEALAQGGACKDQGAACAADR